ncbi:MAG: 2-oxo acid dehydrogenase subunit E2 [Anaerolineales bacterium]|nr:2-oxo acid dehydrogenase subunit E2 [Anaerolineales bacterium]MDW8161777.1 dihydrolipoamide acetyltransferase family protein [Anaerolineales bacterium]
MSVVQASYEIVMPRLGLTMESGVFLKWLKSEGEVVRKGEPLFEIETDKSVAEVEAMEEGVLSRVLARPGETYTVGQLLGYLAPLEGSVLQPTISGERSRTSVSSAETKSVQPPLSTVSMKPKASPAARHLAKQLGVDLSQVVGSGPGGRVVAWNVRAAAERSSSVTPSPSTARVSPVAQRLATELGIDLSEIKGSGPGGTIIRRDVEAAYQSQAEPAAALTSAEPLGEEATLELPSAVQRRMAERMVQSFTTAPHFYLQSEVDGRNLIALRQSLLQPLENRYGVHLTFTDLFIYFVARLLPRHPQLMKQWGEKGLVRLAHVDIGIAVDTEQGLFVPVLRDADRLGLAEISRQRAELAERARQGKLLPRDYERGVFTVTNLGVWRVDVFQAILNPPQAAILAIGRIKERPLVENGVVIAAPTFTLSLSGDHRVLDGAQAARFLSELVEWLETPALSMA